MRYALLLVLVFALAACRTVVEPPPVADEGPPITAPEPVDPLPEPEPGADWAPLGECPLEVDLFEVARDAIVYMRLGDPCEAEQFVPFVFREQSKITWIDYTPIVEGFVFDGEGIRINIPYASRANRYEIVDDRDGTVIASIQNYRLRVVR